MCVHLGPWNGNEETDLTVPGPQADASGGGNDLFLMAMVWVVLGVLLYLFRPSSLRNRGDTKPARLDQGGPGNNPPPTAN
ncbi:hypothetical protein FJT64_022388 [Amphibalanus amphitrite]|uniref:Small integral membrane protein 14 n=1 Tax=Amphibalanus amphitrite TaxID=1232801 RepID=A0A6A4WUV1_AMPAM|nr:hypothetical protein FJT64_022388 [Amphibalanus amphitrite]